LKTNEQHSRFQPAQAELVEALLSSACVKKEGQAFDKLRLSGTHKARWVAGKALAL
jgi:hypothetical protein